MCDRQKILYFQLHSSNFERIMTGVKTKALLSICYFLFLSPPVYLRTLNPVPQNILTLRSSPLAGRLLRCFNLKVPNKYRMAIEVTFYVRFMTGSNTGMPTLIFPYVSIYQKETEFKTLKFKTASLKKI